MPKYIVRKETKNDYQPVEEQRSSLAVDLGNLKKKQQEAFSKLSPDGVKTHDLIRDHYRYMSLPEFIDALKIEIDKLACRVMASASLFLSKSESCSLHEVSCDQVVANKSRHELISDMQQAGIALAVQGKNLVAKIKKLTEYENELEGLEGKIMDDSNLPDFDAMKHQEDNVGIEKISKNASDVSKSEDVVRISL